MAEWQIESLDKRAVCHKRRRTATCPPQPLATLPNEWRELLARWVRRGGNSRWETLLNDAGVTHVQMAQALLDWLVRNGWASLTEQRKLNDWWPQHLELMHLPQLRAALGLRDKDDETQRWQHVRNELAATLGDSLAPALLALDELPVQRALSRYELILALQHWQDAQRSGTRRDFALAARQDTKGLSESEWDWLEQTVDLAEFHIERHTPQLLLVAALTLTSPQGQLDLSCHPDFAALTPATIQGVAAVSGTIKYWKLVENRTSFERVARQHEIDVGVIWLPGFPPSWWCKSVGHLLDMCPAPALIACDPDPAGISIALKAAAIWEVRNLKWQPWRMTASDLASLSIRKPLTDGDKLQIVALRQNTVMPIALLELLDWMQKHCEKGEQEGFL